MSELPGKTSAAGPSFLLLQGFVWKTDISPQNKKLPLERHCLVIFKMSYESFRHKPGKKLMTEQSAADNNVVIIRRKQLAPSWGFRCEKIFRTSKEAKQ